MGEEKKKNAFTSSSMEFMEKNMAGGRIRRYITTGEYNNITAAKRQKTASQQGWGGGRSEAFHKQGERFVGTIKGNKW